MKATISTFLVILLICLSLTGCPLVRATGDTVQATGEGVAHAVEGTGDAVGRAGRDLAN
jgi:predicted small secreted protein